MHEHLVTALQESIKLIRILTRDARGTGDGQRHILQPELFCLDSFVEGAFFVRAAQVYDFGDTRLFEFDNCCVEEVASLWVCLRCWRR